MKAFLEQLADRLLDIGEELPHTAVILPSRRAITFLKKALAEQSDRPIFLPRIFTLDDLARSITGLRPADPMRIGLELYRCYSEIDDVVEEFDVFDAWSTAILKDFNTLDTYLIEAEQLYTDLGHLKAINDWSFLAEELGAEQDEFNRFWMRLGPLYNRFNASLRERGEAYSGAIMREAAIRSSTSQVLPYISRFLFAGFNALSKAEELLIDSLQSQDRCEVYWDDAPFIRENSLDPAGLFMRKWKHKDWKQTFNDGRSETLPIHISSHPHAISQCMMAGGLLQNMEKHEEVAIVLADESMLGALVEQFPHSVEHVNITIGMSFRDTSVYGMVKSYMTGIIQADRSEDKGLDWQIHHAPLKEWMEIAARFGLIGYDLLRKLEFQVKKNRNIFFPESDLRALLGDGPVDRYGLATGVPSSMIRALIHQLEDINSRDRLSEGVATRMKEIIEQSEEVIATYSFIRTGEQVWRSLQSALARERLSFIGEPLRGLQVMGLLETRALYFDQVILLGANEGKLPKGRSYDTFLPHDIRAHYKLPTQYEEDAIFAYYFSRLLFSTDRLHIAYTSERDEFGGGEKSRYISQLEAGLPQRWGLQTDITHEDYPVRPIRVPGVEVEVPMSPIIQNAIDVFLERGVSFSRLSEFTRCPLDFYYKVVLGMGEEDEVEEEIGSSELGSVVHEVLEDAFATHMNGAVITTQALEDMHAGIDERLEAVMEKYALQQLSESGESALVKAMAREMLHNFFLREKKRIRGKNIHILGLEERLEYETRIVLGGQERSVRFKAFIDRVEQVDGQVVLIDYKSGKVNASDLVIKKMDEESLFDPKKSKALQLLYYQWLYYRVKEQEAQAAIISMLGMDTEVKPLVMQADGLEQAEILEEFEQMLYGLIERLYNTPVFRHETEHGKYCQYCVELEESEW
ncbi:MAG: hypothetical protein HKN79_01600 [Flavobacteriales bacterium]|nr:hypothetical protein [Flavobacteriales bacterium]